MTEITKKLFISVLSNNPSVLVGSAFRRSDSWLTTALDRVNPDRIHDPKNYRTVTHATQNDIEFSTGSKLSLRQNGKKVYFMTKNARGDTFLVQKTTTWDDFDQKYNDAYVVYALPEDVGMSKDLQTVS